MIKKADIEWRLLMLEHHLRLIDGRLLSVLGLEGPTAQEFAQRNAGSEVFREDCLFFSVSEGLRNRIHAAFRERGDRWISETVLALLERGLK